MARMSELPPTEEEVLEKKPHHPDSTALIILTTVFFIGAISFTWSHLFGTYLGLADEDLQALEQEQSPANFALDVVISKDLDSDEMKRLVQQAQATRE